MIYSEIIIDADLCIKLGSSQKYRYLELLLPCLAEKIYIHETVNSEIMTPRSQLDKLIGDGKISILSVDSLSDEEEILYNETYALLAKVMMNKNNPNKNKGEVCSLAMAKTKGIPYFATDEKDLQPIVDQWLNTGLCNIQCKRIIDIIEMIKNGQLPNFGRKDAKLIWIITGKNKEFFDKEIWPLPTL